MKPRIVTLLLLLPIWLSTLNSFSQCTPASPEQCPDPENNGQVCPDSLVMAHVGLFYSQVATIKPPLVYYLPPDSTIITLHHVKLMEVGNLPSGLTWQSNTTDSIFMAGEYYCVLMEGTPDLAGNYPLHIVVDVYAIVLPGFPPIKVATVTDSTSLTLVVADDAGIKGDENAPLFVRQNIPNPFQDITRIDFYSRKEAMVDFEVYSILGQRVYSRQVNASRGENFLVFDGQLLPVGPYFYIFRSEKSRSTGMMIRKD